MLWGTFFEKIHKKAPILLREMFRKCKKKAGFGFATKKHSWNKDTTLIFSLEVHECFSFRNIKKICFGF
jgi:hypothetical protein